MEQTTGTQRNAGSRRAFWFVSILFALVVLGAGLGTILTLRAAESSLRRDMEHRLDAQARSRVAALTVWYGGLRAQVNRLVEPDLFRLFGSEVNGLGKDVTFLLQASRTGERVGELGELAAQLSIMRKVLRDFVDLSGMVSARMINQSLQEYLSSEAKPEPFNPAQQDAIREVFATGKIKVLPVRLGAEGLLLDLAHPVFAPKYAPDPEGKPVAVFLLTWNVSEKIREIALPSGEKSAASLFVQQAGDILQEVRPDGVVRDLPGWVLVKGSLPLAVRELPNGIRVYALGGPVPDVPWLAVESFKESSVLEDFRGTRNMIFGIAGASAFVCLLLLGAIWWWLVGRRERVVSAELAGLYHTVHRQSQFLTSINGAMGGGIMLTDLNGIIHYANATFGRMVGHSSEALTGLSGPTLLGEACSVGLKNLFEVVSSSGTLQTCTGMTQQDSKTQHYHIVCSPFRDEDANVTGIVSVFQDVSELIEAQDRTQRMVEQTVKVLVGAIEAVDPYLRGQSAMMMRLALRIVSLMRLGKADEETIRIAANLFQVGMIQLPHDLLTKQGQLTSEERALLQKHVEYARNSLSGIDFGLPVVEAICQMHECMDGSGYPAHLKGEEIGIHGRILAVANTFCALVRPRSYRQARGIEEALGILSETPPRYDVEIVGLVSQFLKTPEGQDFIDSVWKKDAVTSSFAE